MVAWVRVAACMVGCTRSSLNVVAAEKGIVVGRLIFDDDGDTYIHLASAHF